MPRKNPNLSSDGPRHSGLVVSIEFRSRPRGNRLEPKRSLWFAPPGAGTTRGRPSPS